jgi:hypothetical protein
MLPGWPVSTKCLTTPLHQQEWTARVGVELTVPELKAGVQQSAAVCEAGRVDESVDIAKARQSSFNQPVAVICGRDVCLHK